MSGYLIGGAIIFAVWLLTIFKAVNWSSSRERDKQAASELAARDIHDEVQSDIGAMSSEQIRAELAKRARP